jgi:hypothetical protein
MNILGTRCSRQLTSCSLRSLEQLKSSRYHGITRVQFARPCISVDRVRDLVVTTLVQATKIKPNFGNVRVDTNGPGVGVEGVAELVDLEVKDSYRTPKRGVPTVTVNGLLIGLVGFIVLLTGHICATKKVPTLSI